MVLFNYSLPHNNEHDEINYKIQLILMLLSQNYNK